MPSRRRWLAIAVVWVLALTGAIGLLATSVPPADVDAAGVTAVNGSGAPIERLETLHGAGVTGENVTVGVVDVTGFDPTAPAIDSQVVATRAFGSASVRNAGRSEHGTAAAALVARVAPDADLALATFDSVAGYERAMAWLVERADVVVAPVSFYGAPGDGTGRAARITSEATRSGTVVVAPTGNLARGHWSGTYRQRDGKLRFSGGTRNYVRGDDRTLRLWLSWDRPAQDYTAELYWTNGSATRLVARSQPYRADEVTNERMSVRLAGGSYFVVVRGPDESTNATVQLVSPTHRFQYRQRAGSVAAPATAQRVLSVGAYDHRRGRLEPFSSRGPLPDGRPGVDVVAPDRLPTGDGATLVGSSASAPYVAGVAALVLDADADRSPAGLERLVEASARDLNGPGPDSATGHGLVRPRAAVANATGD